MISNAEISEGIRAVTWKPMDNNVSQEDWDNQLLEFGDFTPYQLYGWGELRRSLGWTPIRLAAYDGDNSIVSMMQALYRPNKFGSGFLWSSGGPVGDITYCGKDLRKALKETTGARFLYTRIFSNKQHSQDDQRHLEEQGWSYCKRKLRSGLSMSLNLDRSLDDIHGGLSSNWKRNLKRSGKRGLIAKRWESIDVEEVLSVYQSMESYKGLEEQFSKEELTGLLKELSDYLVVFRCENESGELLALRGCIFIGNYGWDMLAATTVAGRKAYASYLWMWEILKHCHEAGVQHYDLMGIDPENSPGVYNFKKGTGAEHVQYLGEWESATFGGLSTAVNFMIGRKRNYA